MVETANKDGGGDTGNQSMRVSVHSFSSFWGSNHIQPSSDRGEAPWNLAVTANLLQNKANRSRHQQTGSKLDRQQMDRHHPEGISTSKHGPSNNECAPSTDTERAPLHGDAHSLSTSFDTINHSVHSSANFKQCFL